MRKEVRLFISQCFSDGCLGCLPCRKETACRADANRNDQPNQETLRLKYEVEPSAQHRADKASPTTLLTGHASNAAMVQLKMPMMSPSLITITKRRAELRQWHATHPSPPAFEDVEAHGGH
jgi:hypothetical protein